jgi:hypothetical protein
MTLVGSSGPFGLEGAVAVYYLFRGLRRGSGEPVIGRLFALNEEAVHEILEAHAIIADTVGPEEAGNLFPPTLEAALDEAGVRVTFNQMAKEHEGNGVWILKREKIRSRVMQLSGEALVGAEDRQSAHRSIEQLLETLYGDKRPDPTAAGAGEGRFANADEVRAEMRRLMESINKLERELISIRSRPSEDREPRRSVTKSAPLDRSRDDVLREIFEHNLELMKLTWEQGITAPAGQ